jgi:hypothetical protein
MIVLIENIIFVSPSAIIVGFKRICFDIQKRITAQLIIHLPSFVCNYFIVINEWVESNWIPQNLLNYKI